jgi:hypothetical protein
MEHLLNRNTLRGFELRQGIEAFAKRLTKVLNLRNIRVTWSPATTTAAIDSGGQMYLANVADDVVVNRAMIVRYAGFVLHELLHRKYTNFNVQGSGHYLCALHNAVEDAYIENKCVSTGLVGNGEGLLGELIDLMTREALAAVTDWADPAQYPFALAVYLRKHGTVKVPLADGLQAIFDGAAARLNNAASSRDTLDIATWVLAQLKALPQDNCTDPQDDAMTDPQPEDGEDEGEGADGEGAADGDKDGAQGDEQGEGEGAAGDEGNNGAGEGEGEGKPSKSKGKAGKATAPTPATQAAPVEPTLDPQGAAGGTYFGENQMRNGAHHLAGATVLDAPAITTPARLRADVRALFENTDTSGFDSNRRTGTINVNALHKVGIGSDRVFKRRFDSDGIDSAVVILLDVSGSMFSKSDALATPAIVPAIQTCDALVDSLTSAGVAVCVMTFGSYVSVAVPFGAPATRAKALMRQVCDRGEGTEDSASLRHAHGLLLARPEARRVCFVLTDGNGDRAGVKAQCASGAALGITTVGVGIGYAADVHGIYTNPIKVTNLSDLATTALKQIKVVA